MTQSSSKRTTAKKRVRSGPGDGLAWEQFLQRFDARAESRAEEQIGVRRHLHTFPEPSGEEVETTRFIAERLRSVGLEPLVCRSDKDVPTGVRTDLELGRVTEDSPTVALRCDIDALRMTDAKTVEYRSRREGVAHACGHDAHTAIVLGAAVAASETARETADVLAGMQDVGMRLRLIFQPSEEMDGGARWMVEQGAMDGVDVILGVHVDPERPCGRVGIRYGVLTASADAVEISVQGQGGHAARPHQSIDPIAAASHLITSLYEFLPRRVDSRHPAVFTVGQIRGGSAPNVIPDRVDIAGTLRTTDEAHRGALKIEIDRICSACELSTGVHIQRRFHNSLGSVVNDPRCAAALERAAETVLGPDRIDHIHLPSMGAEDFAFYLDHAPGAMLRLGSGRAGVENPFLHSPHFDIDERALLSGTRILMRAALDVGRSIAREEW